MPGVLSNLRVVEVSAYVAAPLGGMTLAQLGADLIQISPKSGRIDYNRWPQTDDGKSLYWAGLNKAKRSIRIDLARTEGQELAAALIAGKEGDGGGILMTNLPSRGWMSYEALKQRRDDLIMLKLTGNYDGSAAVDYTVNCASGFPMVTGDGTQPINHAIPVWDIATGLYLATGTLAAVQHRQANGKGQEVSIALSDVMLATVGNLGYIAEVQMTGRQRPAIGNHLYGGFGRDFATQDGRAVMVAAFSDRQWQSLLRATGTEERMPHVAAAMGVDLADEAGRYAARDAIAAVLAPWFAARTLADIRQAFEGSGVLWGPFQDFLQLVAEDVRCSTANPLFREAEQPGIGSYLTPHIPLSFGAAPHGNIVPAPALGQHSEAVLADVLGLPSGEIGRLFDAGLVAGPDRE
ncbi:CoA transferase [Oceanibaculum indicum]|uniref:2-methylfumaryl-CoA isomerase n=1 Tax=Oceanibaculum indicum TaxID=526216 RepID=A0A420WP81_9PROT|nr:CoA transferase [Oceanibaculum indicum]RKQ72851.1 2-methylfumaryl-CoA isomerase [Oceanibaculum indicum]